ncbi:hypothetical protein [Mesorhizobium neociceri]|uniref:HEAT repeat domain-containing protein n=1 Tax=Mesorhizobium neociceri TaxID=1307853 RepID=A0A838B4F8_9HYPH|nr:hypothetical protein [Mesorhizobium neociceri]MBA1140729.1 hypothetical protein [Mesorhizobium neociceri]
MSKLLAPGFEGDSELTFALQSEFHKGFPLENLRPLLTSDNLHTQAAAAYLVAEISPRISYRMNCVVAEIADLLDSKIVRIRFDAIEALLGCTTPDDGAILGRVMLGLDDEQAGVRWKVVQFICLAERWQLQLAVENAAARRQDSAFGMLVNAYGRYSMPRSKDLPRLLAHPDAVLRRFAAAMAIRPREVIVERFVAMAEQSDDAEIRKIAADCRQGYLRPTYAIGPSIVRRPPAEPSKAEVPNDGG